MKPENRIGQARKQLRIAGESDELSENQSTALAGLSKVLFAMEQSIDKQREQEVMTDGGAAVPERYQPEPRQWEDKRWLQKQYWGELKPIQQIADEQGVSQDAIGDRLDEFGIPTRVQGYTYDNSISPFAGFYNGTDSPGRTDAASRTRYDPDFESGHEAETNDDGSFRWGVVDSKGDRR